MVLVVDEEGTNLGIMSLEAANKIAQEKGLDLVEVSPHARPPVCRLLNHDRYRYVATPRIRSPRRNQTSEVQIRTSIGEHDLLHKIAKIQELLSQNRKVLVRIRVPTRAGVPVHPDSGAHLIGRIAKALENVDYDVPKKRGNEIILMLSPRKNPMTGGNTVDRVE